MDAELLAEVGAHDAALARRELEIWIGAEPTFTDRRSQDPWWLGQAQGGDKEERARDLLLRLAPRLSGSCRLLRVRGREYPGEAEPRFCLGALWSRRAAAWGEIDGSGLGGQPGHPLPAPKVAQDQAWLTLTPDPGVVEVNMAPAPDLAAFLSWAGAVYAAADEVGLSPVRYRYNGEATDSGGGGQVTLGGPSPERSPFFLRPQLLPRLVRYANRHPSLSYAFAPDCAGSAGQGPRADEGVRERFEELPVALDRLAARGDRVMPEELWSALAPLLVDASGNSHRAEINVEKLWNPSLGERGRLGVVELRALRMPPTPERLVAVAALFRALAARLAAVPYEEPLVDWGASLHELFGLPWFQRQDLEAVLDDLEDRGFGLGPRLRQELLSPQELVAAVELDGARLEIAPAVAFWPLFGDVASQERSGARLVDSSAVRLQLLVTAPPGELPGTIAAAGWRVPLQPLEGDASRHLGSVIYRAFPPRPGLHPGLPSSDPLVLIWERGSRRLSLLLHGWNPTGGAYHGLPDGASEARRRRRERVSISSQTSTGPSGPGRPGRDTGFTLDLRRVVEAARPPAAPARP